MLLLRCVYCNLHPHPLTDILQVAAGNNGADARNTSPARAASAITVGATDINDQFAYFSNYGPKVDMLCPGVAVTSCWIGSNTVSDCPPKHGVSSDEPSSIITGYQHYLWHFDGITLLNIVL